MQPIKPNMTRPRKEPDKETYSGRFAIRLRTLREKAGLTVDEVAEQVGVTLNTVYHWEKAYSFPKCEQLPLIAEVLKLKGVRAIFPEK